MKVDEAFDYIHSTSWRGSVLGLSRIQQLLSHLGNPQNRLRFIHVAGTNGKGSICAMLSSILTHAGYKTGLYISPYIHRFNERIQVNGMPISDDELIAATQQVRVYAEQMEDHPTEFELITTIALSHFEQVNCDIVVMEVGLGGRLDATNVIPVPDAAVITSISLDHVAELGDTLEKIAAEKAGIIKPGGEVVLYPQIPGVEWVVENICDERGAHLEKVNFNCLNVKMNDISGQYFDFLDWRDLRLSLLGDYQPSNAATALKTITLLRAKGWAVSDAAIHNGLADTKWPARFEIIHHNPYVVVDGGHNPQCVESIVTNLERFFPEQKIIFLFGVMADKDYGKMVDIVLPHAKRIITISPDNPRALPAAELSDHICAKGFLHVTSSGSVEQGVETALYLAEKKDIICAFGSFYMAGVIRACFGLH